MRRLVGTIALLVCVAGGVAFTLKLTDVATLFADSESSGIVVEDTNVGPVAAMETKTFRVTVSNRTPNRVKLVGVQVCCGLEITSYPAVIEAASDREILGKIRFPSASKQTVSEGVIYVDSDGLLEIPFQVFAEPAVNNSKKDSIVRDTGQSILDSADSFEKQDRKK